ncbi:MAG: agmatine deiminase family protein [Methyloceanibacter sp.]|nr:agmatine deiminase family protein [Methyloceanibacter sp.]
MPPSTTYSPAVELRLLPEWAPQRAIWTAWPASSDEWNGDLEPPRRDVAALINALAPANHVRLLVKGAEAQRSAEREVGHVADIVAARYGDIWVRDTGPLFAASPDGARALRFHTNGWGGKFILPGDDTVGDDIAEQAGLVTQHYDFVLEGGAIDHDGAGTVLTTKQVLLNENRNGWSQTQAENALAAALGARKIVWLDAGIDGDHTDGHVDNVARFVGPGRIAIQEPAGPDDPNAAVLAAAAQQLRGVTDASGRSIEIVPVPSPGRILDAFGHVAPASHLNFTIANRIVVVPVFGTSSQADALRRLQAVFPSRKVVGLPALGILGSGGAGGGAFHCITREEPDFDRECLSTH